MGAHTAAAWSGPGPEFCRIPLQRWRIRPGKHLFLSRALAQKIGFCKGLRQYEDHLFFIEAGARGASYVCVLEALSVWRNEARADRLGNTEDVARIQAFFDAAGPLMPMRARVGLESWPLGPRLWHDSPLRACGQMIRAWSYGAMPLSRIVAGLLRSFVPPHLYDQLRRSVDGRTAGAASHALALN